MTFIKKKWVNVSDPSNPPPIPEGQDALARFDADNMNRIEDGIEKITEDLLRIATGTYDGTGTYGIENPNTLTFPFQPKVVFLQCDQDIDVYLTYEYKISGMTQTGKRDFKNPRYKPLVYGCPITYCEYENGNTNFATPSDIDAVNLAWSENTVSWYSNKTSSTPDAYLQLNAQGVTYRYVAIG